MPPRAKVASCVLTTFTKAAFQRCTGDWQQVVHGMERGVPGRMLKGVLVNLDESYKFLRMLGLVTPEKKGQDAAGLSYTAGEFNRLMQTGTASLATKTSGSFGEGPSPSVSVGLAGPAHPSVIIPVGRGEVGSNHVASKERLIFVTGAPVEPHDSLPARLVLPASHDAWKWPPLLRCMVDALGLPEGVACPNIAAATLQRATASDVDSQAQAASRRPESDVFIPDGYDYRIDFRDGSESRLRFRQAQAADGTLRHPCAECRRDPCSEPECPH